MSRHRKETREERMARYDRERRDAIEAIKKLAQARGGVIPLSEVAPLLPEIPEWETYR